MKSEDLGFTEYYLRRYNKIILKWMDESERPLKEVQNLLTAFLLRYQGATSPKREYIEKYFNFLEAAPLNILERALSAGQFQSKQWLREELLRLKLPSLGNTLVLGGWMGLLGPILLHDNALAIEKLFSIDLDPQCLPLADLLNTPWLTRQWQFKAITGDATTYDFAHFKAHTQQEINGEIHEIDFEVHPVNTIINTSCEHFALDSWLPKVPKGTLLIAQSNDNEDLEEHNFCHESLQDFESALMLDKVILCAEMTLPTYKRFLVIGQK